MTSLVLGTVQFGINYGINNSVGRQGVDQVTEILKLAFENNITQLDTAQDYGEAEAVLSQSLQRLQYNFLVHTKFILGNKSLQESVNQSLNNLKISNLGYFYFHRFADYLSLKNSNSLSGLKLENCLGLAVSVYNEEEIQSCIDDENIKAIQVGLNLFDCAESKINLLKLAQFHGKKIYVRSVFLQGLFFMDTSTLPDKLQSLKAPLDELRKIAHEYKIDIRSLSLGFVKVLLPAEGILIGVDNKEQLQENLDAWSTILDHKVINEVKKIQIPDRSMLLPVNWK